MDTYISRQYEETIEYGRRLGSSLRGGEVVILSGQLGSGKTVLTKGIALGIGIDEVVTSPSFAIMNLYQGSLGLCHADFYRIGDRREMEDLLEDYLYHERYVTVIEWGESLLETLLSYLYIRIDIMDDHRVLTFEKRDSAAYT